MDGTTTSLARTPAPLAEARRYFAFLRRPALPARAAGFSQAALGRVLRLYLLDLAIMAVLLSLATAALAGGFTLPENEINSIKMSPAVVALVVLVAPLVEEIGFRSWLSGRPGHVLAALALAAGAGALSALASAGGKPAVPPIALVGAVLAAAVLALVLLRGRAPMGWFVRGFPLFFALSSIAFALAHLFNYKEGTLGVLLPLVVPQLIAGTIFGYARVTYGLWSSVLLHVLHNATAIGLVLATAAIGGGGGAG